MHANSISVCAFVWLIWWVVSWTSLTVRTKSLQISALRSIVKIILELKQNRSCLSRFLFNVSWEILSLEKRKYIYISVTYHNGLVCLGERKNRTILDFTRREQEHCVGNPQSISTIYITCANLIPKQEKKRKKEKKKEKANCAYIVTLFMASCYCRMLDRNPLSHIYFVYSHV